MHILLTGAAGFIGFHFATKLLKDGHTVVGVDNINDYYEVSLKEARLALLKKHSSFSFTKLALENKTAVDTVFNDNKFDIVVHLGAQAGVRYSIDNPQAYIDSNVTGTANILEACRVHQPKHLMYASSSSVYGTLTQRPFNETMQLAKPASTYAATKIANEAQVGAYASMFGVKSTGLRFFTVYGPWGRPDMAFFKFTKAILAGEPIDVYNHGDMLRDFTYVDDIIGGMNRLLTHYPDEHEVYNIGNGRTVKLGTCIDALEAALGKKAIINSMPMQTGDVPVTESDTSKLYKAVGFKPNTSIEDGLKSFTTWYKDYYQ